MAQVLKFEVLLCALAALLFLRAAMTRALRRRCSSTRFNSSCSDFVAPSLEPHVDERECGAVVHWLASTVRVLLKRVVSLESSIADMKSSSGSVKSPNTTAGPRVLLLHELVTSVVPLGLNGGHILPGVSNSTFVLNAGAAAFSPDVATALETPLLVPHTDPENGQNLCVSAVEPCTSGVGRVAVFGPAVGTESRGRSTDQVEKDPDNIYVTGLSYI